MNYRFVLIAGDNTSKSYNSYIKAKKMAEAWKGQFSLFHEILIYKDGQFLERV